MKEFQALLAQLLRSAARFLSPSDSSTPPSPQTSTPSDTALAIQAMERMAEKMTAETKELVLSILQGRPTQGAGETTAPLGRTATLSVTNYDDDSIPLAPGIEATIQREEAEESALALLQAQRADLAERLSKQTALLAEMGMTPPTTPANPNGPTT
jgi:hypothetical protein